MLQAARGGVHRVLSRVSIASHLSGFSGLGLLLFVTCVVKISIKHIYIYSLREGSSRELPLESNLPVKLYPVYRSFNLFDTLTVLA